MIFECKPECDRQTDRNTDAIGFQLEISKAALSMYSQEEAAWYTPWRETPRFSTTNEARLVRLEKRVRIWNLKSGCAFEIKQNKPELEFNFRASSLDYSDELFTVTVHRSLLPFDILRSELQFNITSSTLGWHCKSPWILQDLTRLSGRTLVLN